MIPCIFVATFNHIGQGDQKRCMHFVDGFVFAIDIRDILHAVVAHFHKGPVQIFNLVAGAYVELTNFLQIVRKSLFIIEEETVRSFCHGIDGRNDPTRHKRGQQQNAGKDTGEDLGQPFKIPVRVISQVVHRDVHRCIALAGTVMIIHRRINRQQPAKLIIGNNRFDSSAF